MNLVLEFSRGYLAVIKSQTVHLISMHESEACSQETCPTCSGCIVSGGGSLHTPQIQ